MELFAESKLCEAAEPSDWDFSLVLADVQKAYPRVVRSAMQQVLRRSGVPEQCVTVMMGLHAMTRYCIRTRGDQSEWFQLSRGLREGCPSSPAEFNIFHSHAMAHFHQRMEAVFPGEGVPIGCTESRPLRWGGQRTTSSRNDAVEMFQLLEVLFADDTNMMTRARVRAETEGILESTMEAWGQKIAPQKYERLHVGNRFKEEESHLYNESVRFLGAWLSGDGKFDRDTEERLNRAKAVWRRIFAQLPRWGLKPITLGRLVSSTVLATLLYGMEARLVTAPQLKKMETFWNKVVQGLGCQRIRDMRAQRVTMADIRRKFSLRTIRVYLGERKLRFVGHVARLPHSRLERKILMGWIEGLQGLPRAHKGGQRQSTRTQYSKRIDEALQYLNLGGSSRYLRERAWLQFAEDRLLWNRIVRSWVKREQAKDDRWLWEAKHGEGGILAINQTKQNKLLESVGHFPKSEECLYQCPTCLADGIHTWWRPAPLARHLTPCSKRSSVQRLQYARSKEVRDRARQREAPPAAPEPVRRVAPVPRQECQPTTVASVTALPRVQAATARLHPRVVPMVSEPGVRRRLSCKRKAPLPAPVSAPLRRRIVGKPSLEVTRQTEPQRKNRQTSSLFTVPRAVISQLARQRRVHSAAIQEALHESASSISDSTLQHISSVRTARAKRTDDKRGERKRAYRSFYPSGGWNSTIGQQTLRQTLLNHPIPVEKFQRQCHGKCVPCCRCYRCREYGCCFGGRYQNWGCDKCSKCILCRTSLNDEEYTLASIRLARRGTIPPTISGLQRPPRPDGADPC